MGVTHAYQPFPKPECTTTVEEMQAKLAARVAAIPKTPAPQLSEAAQSPKEKAALEWDAPVKGSMGIKTKCKRYSCAKVSLDGKLSYELWKQRQEGYAMLNRGLDNFLQAQKLAQLDADKGPP